MINSNESKQKYLQSIRKSIPLILQEISLLDKSIQLESDAKMLKKLKRQRKILRDHLEWHETLGIETRPLLKEVRGVDRLRVIRRVEDQVKSLLEVIEGANS